MPRNSADRAGKKAARIWALDDLLERTERKSRCLAGLVTHKFSDWPERGKRRLSDVDVERARLLHH